MDVTLTARVPCVICGYRLKAFRFASMRITKRSMRGSTYLGCGPGACPECGFHSREPLPDGPWQVMPDDLTKIAAYRLRRWPELAKDAVA